MRVIILFLALGGCSALPPTPQVVDRPVKVDCIREKVQRPDFPTDSLAPDASDFDKIKAITLDWTAYRSYVPKLEAVQDGCISK